MTKKKKEEEMPVKLGSEKDLIQLRKSTKETYEALRDAENDIPLARKEEYWGNRHLARMALEKAENAVFANLVEEQKRRLPAVAKSNAKLAKDVQAATNVLAMLDLVTASLSVLAEVIVLLARAMAK